MTKPLLLKELFWALTLPPAVAAVLEWASGLIIIDESPAEFERILNAGKDRSASDRAVVETLTHESVHFLQVVTTGFLFVWATRWYDLVVEAMQSTVEPQQDRSDVRDLVVHVDERVRPAQRHALAAHQAVLDRPHQTGLTIRCLFESQAMHTEYCMHMRPNNADGFYRYLGQRSVPTEYRLAYDVARLRLGDDAAFALLPLLTSVALCCSEPTEAFDRLLFAAAQREDLRAYPPDVATWQTLVDDIVPDLFIGTAVAQPRSPTPHPVYSEAVSQLQAKHDAPGAFSVEQFLVRPLAVFDQIIETVRRPILLRPGATGDFPIWSPTADGNALVPKDETIFLVAIAGVSTRLLNASYDPSAPAAVSASLRRLAWTSTIYPIPRMIELSEEESQVAAVPGFLREFDPQRCADSPGDLRRSWGRFILKFPATGDVVSARSDTVRAFISAVHDQMPSFPAYLTFQPGSHMFWLWFGALADENAWHTRSEFDPGHPSVMDRIVESLTAMWAWGRHGDVDIGPQVRAMFRLYERGLADAMLDALAASDPAG